MILFIDFCGCAGPRWSRGPFSHRGEWGHSDCGARASVGRGFCLDHRLLGTPAALLHSTWELPGSGIEPMSPALAGGFFAKEPPGKPHPGLPLWKVNQPLWSDTPWPEL